MIDLEHDVRERYVIQAVADAPHEELRLLISNSIYSWMRRCLRERSGWAVIEYLDETVTGWAVAAPFGPGVGLSVFVHEDMRRQGRGERLVRLVQAVAENEYPGRCVIVGPVDEAGARLFAKTGLYPKWWGRRKAV
jgi:GNAT superfamily N-acetyltransferase